MKTKLDRREFLALSAAAGLAGYAASPSATKWTGTDKIKALLLHLGHNMWCEWLPDDVQRVAEIHERYRPDDTLRNKDELWRRVVDRMAKRGLNMLVIDVGEGLVYPSHPELAIKGSWSPDKLRDEVVRLRGMGIEAIPKLNFSATHDGWLKHYHRMLTLPKYYEVVKDVIRDVAEVFQTPRFFHLGYDEETVGFSSNRNYFVMRAGEMWWHDFLYTVKCAEDCGCRPWVWSDYIRRHPLEEFCRKMPKTVVQNPWTYRATKAKMAGDPLIKIYSTLAEAGYDVAPCGSNCYGVTENFPEMSVYCKATLPAERFKGMIMAPWIKTIAPYRRLHWQAADLMAEAIQRTGL